MKNALLLIFLVITLKVTAQTRIKDGLYTTTSGDTVVCKILTTPTITGKIDFSSFSKKVTIVQANEKIKFSPNEIKSFTVRDDEGIGHTFVSLAGDNSRFFNEVIKGRLSLYFLYSAHPYDGSSSKIPIMVKDEKIVYLNVINSKQRIGNLIADCPELFKKWTETDKYSVKDREILVKAYNNCNSYK